MHLAPADLGAGGRNGLPRRGDGVGGVDDEATGGEGGVGEHAARAADLLLLRPALAAVAAARGRVLSADLRARRRDARQPDVPAFPPLFA